MEVYVLHQVFTLPANFFTNIATVPDCSDAGVIVWKRWYRFVLVVDTRKKFSHFFLIFLANVYLYTRNTLIKQWKTYKDGPFAMYGNDTYINFLLLFNSKPTQYFTQVMNE
jgi:hypothetical protein